MKKKARFICIEPGCHKKVWKDNTRCRLHAEKYKKYPSRRGRNNNQYIDGRTTKKYYCIDCNKLISSYSGVYGTGRCKSCSAKNKLKDPRNHPMYGNSREDLKIKFKGSGNPMFGKKWTEKQKKEASIMRSGNGNGMFGKHHTEEGKEKIRQTCIRTIKAGKFNISPNKLEKALNKLLKKLLPNEYKFVGNFKFWIDGFCPDFVNINGQKKIIELYGDYWHNREDAKKRDRRRIKAYKQYGYQTLIVWEHEFKNIKQIKNKILLFTKCKVK